MGITGSSKVVFSKYQKQKFINKTRNRELASHIKTMSDEGK